MARSGTTIIFELISRHPDLGWPTNYCASFPNKLWMNSIRRFHDNKLFCIEARKKQYGNVIKGNRFLAKPAEAYSFWNLYANVDFSYNSLTGQFVNKPTSFKLHNTLMKLLKYQGRKRLAAKFTGPPRLQFLHSIFPDAKFVHIIRDGRAVVHSLLNVDFWINKGGLERPYWLNFLSEDDIKIWEKNNKNSGVLAALEWKKEIDLTHKESKVLDDNQFIEIKYENFLANPHKELRNLFSFCELHDSQRAHLSLNKRENLKNMNYKYEKDWSTEYINKISDVMQPYLENYNYY